MKDGDAVRALSALAHDSRLSIFRFLVKHAPNGLPAGAIATEIGIKPSNLSFHLSALERASLCTARRDKQQILYAVDLGTARQLLTFLMEDCCQGQPEICGPILGTDRNLPKHKEKANA